MHELNPNDPDIRLYSMPEEDLEKIAPEEYKIYSKAKQRHKIRMGEVGEYIYGVNEKRGAKNVAQVFQHLANKIKEKTGLTVFIAAVPSMNAYFVEILTVEGEEDKIKTLTEAGVDVSPVVNPGGTISIQERL